MSAQGNHARKRKGTGKGYKPWEREWMKEDGMHAQKRKTETEKCTGERASMQDSASVQEMASTQETAKTEHGGGRKRLSKRQGEVHEGGEEQAPEKNGMRQLKTKSILSFHHGEKLHYRGKARG